MYIDNFEKILNKFFITFNHVKLLYKKLQRVFFLLLKIKNFLLKLY